MLASICRKLYAAWGWILSNGSWAKYFEVIKYGSESEGWAKSLLPLLPSSSVQRARWPQHSTADISPKSHQSGRCAGVLRRRVPASLVVGMHPM